MAITTVDTLLSAMVGGSWRSYAKSYSGSSWSGQLSLWGMSGFPAPGALAIGDVVNGVVPTSSTLGAIPFPTVGTSYLSNVLFAVENPSNTANAYKVALYDRVWHAGSFPATSSGNFAGWVGGTALTRPDSTGVDVDVFLEYNTIPSGTSNIILTYTDSAGTPGLTATASFTATNAFSSQVTPFPLSSPFGVRSIQTINIQSSMASGTFNLVLARRLVEVGQAPNGETQFQDADPFVTGLPILSNGACLSGILYSIGTLTSTNLLLRMLIAQG